MCEQQRWNQAQKPDSRADSLRSMHSLPGRQKKQQKKSTSHFPSNIKTTKTCLEIEGKKKKSRTSANLSSPSRIVTRYWFRPDEDLTANTMLGRDMSKGWIIRDPTTKAGRQQLWLRYQDVIKNHHPPGTIYSLLVIGAAFASRQDDSRSPVPFVMAYNWETEPSPAQSVPDSHCLSPRLSQNLNVRWDSLLSQEDLLYFYVHHFTFQK